MANVVVVTEAPSNKVGITGLIGPRGLPGEKGADGTPGGSYVHTQSALSDTWVINHNLHFQPAVTTQDSAGSTIEGNVTFTDSNSLTVTFSVACSGTAYLS